MKTITIKSLEKFTPPGSGLCEVPSYTFYFPQIPQIFFTCQASNFFHDFVPRMVDWLIN